MEHMPVLFVGHGSPMNAIDNNRFSAEWETLGEKIPRPKAILSISAHWFTPGLRITDAASPKVVYDMYGFPEELYQVSYQAPGSPHVAALTKELLGDSVQIDNSWGIDHGTWSVLCRIYPEADIPVVQLSVDRLATAEQYYEIGRRLRPLRDQGILIFGSGNVVHNLSEVNWSMNSKGFSWAEEFDRYIKDSILSRDDAQVIDYRKAGASSKLAFLSMDHYAPLLYILGASGHDDPITVFNDTCDLGALSMTSYLFT